MEQERGVEIDEYEWDLTFLAWCSACNLLLIEDTTQPVAEILARSHIDSTHHLVFVASDNHPPYEP